MSAVGDLTWELCDLDQTVLATLTEREPGAQVTIGREVARTAQIALDLDDEAAALASVGDKVLRCKAAGWAKPLFVGRVMQHDLSYDGGSAELKISGADPLAHLESCLVMRPASVPHVGTGFANGGLAGPPPVSSWSNPSFAAVPDGFAALADQPGVAATQAQTDLLIVGGWNMDIPAGAVIDGIWLGALCAVANNTTNTGGNFHSQDGSVRLLKAGAPVGTDKASASEWARTFQWRSWGGPSDLWGTTWTPAEVNDPGFGSGISGYSYVDAGFGIAQTWYIDAVQMIVYYHDASGPAWQVTNLPGGVFGPSEVSGFMAYFAATDPSTMMSRLVAASADHGHGIEDGTLTAAAADLAAGFPAGQSVAESLRGLAGLSGCPEFEIAPVFASDGQLAELNTYYPQQGSDKTATVTLRLGTGDDVDELLGFEAAPSMAGVSNRHTVVGDAPDGWLARSDVSGLPKDYPLHPASVADHADSQAALGVWESSESASGANTSPILAGVAKAVVAANRNPLTSFKVTLDPDFAPSFGPDETFWIGDTISVELTTPEENVLDFAGRVASATLTEAENGDVLVDLLLEPPADPAGVTTRYLGVLVDASEGTDPPPPPTPEGDPCAPIADTSTPDCPDAGLKSAGKGKGKKKRKKKR